jgi:hypothetical protein
MNMKPYLLALQITAVLVASSVSAQILPKRTPEWRISVKVVDEDGHPVSGADTSVDYYINPPPGQTKNWDTIQALTDTNGLFTASHVDTGSASLGVHIRRAGYYRTDVGHDLGTSYDSARWRLNETLVLKKIGRPVPMYAKWLNLGIPILGQPVGFDLMVGDWVRPQGKGLSPDILFTAQLDKRAENDSDYKLTVSFPKPGDGIQEFNVPILPLGDGSALKSPHEAPADAYQPQWIQTQTRRPQQQMQGNRDLNRNYFFRVRTSLDENGHIKSALYGKIYGDFMYFQYYLNPEANSRNMEFDPSQNLFKNLPVEQQVKRP